MRTAAMLCVPAGRADEWPKALSSSGGFGSEVAGRCCSDAVMFRSDWLRDVSLVSVRVPVYCH